MWFECKKIIYASEPNIVDAISAMKERGGGIFVFNGKANSAHIYPLCDELKAKMFAREYLMQDYFIEKLGPDADDKAYEQLLNDIEWIKQQGIEHFEKGK